MTIEESLASLRQSLDQINKNVSIVAATKTRTIDEIKRCMDTGLCLSAGENRVQELVEKYDPSFRWDFIGQLQTNKVKYIVGKVDLIHSLDRLTLAETIEKVAQKRGIVQNVLLEINSGNEESKGGIRLDETDRFLDEVSKFEHIKVRGMMAVAPLDVAEDELQKIFDGVYKKFRSLQNEQFDILSMGMSNDCLLAVKCGANMVRVGRRIFGERVYPCL